MDGQGRQQNSFDDESRNAFLQSFHKEGGLPKVLRFFKRHMADSAIAKASANLIVNCCYGQRDGNGDAGAHFVVPC